jgi:protein ImuB
MSRSNSASDRAPLFACLRAADRTPPASREAGAALAEAHPGEAVRERLLAAAREFSPRVEAAGAGTVLCDLTGVARLFGDPHTIAAELRREAANRGVLAHVAVATTRTAALLVASAHPGVRVIDPGTEAAALNPLPVRVLDALIDIETDRLDRDDTSRRASDVRAPAARFYRTSPMEDLARQRATTSRRARRVRVSNAARHALDRHERAIATLERWGIRTLGDLAALPPGDLSARLGQDGPAWQRIARGEDHGPLVPALPPERFEARLDLDWPIEALEPLSFVLGRLLEPIAADLARRDRAAAALIVELRLVSRETVTRRLQLPSPLRDPRVLRTLALLDLDAHPPAAGIDAVAVRVEPTPGRVLQHSLLERARPAPEQISTLMARLTALMGDGRCGSPHVPDTYRPGAFTLQPFTADARTGPPRTGVPASPSSAADPALPGDTIQRSVADRPVVETGVRRCALRRFRHPVPIRVALDGQRPVRVIGDRPGIAAGGVETCAGPWHTSGEWWKVDPPQSIHGAGVQPCVSRDAGLPETTPRAGLQPCASGWDRDEWDVALEDGTVCRIFQARDTRNWFMDAVMD